MRIKLALISLIASASAGALDLKDPHSIQDEALRFIGNVSYEANLPVSGGNREIETTCDNDSGDCLERGSREFVTSRYDRGYTISYRNDDGVGGSLSKKREDFERWRGNGLVKFIDAARVFCGNCQLDLVSSEHVLVRDGDNRTHEGLKISYTLSGRVDASGWLTLIRVPFLAQVVESQFEGEGRTTHISRTFIAPSN